MISRLGIIIVDGRQYMPQVSFTTQATQHQNQPSIVNTYPSVSQPASVGTHGPLFVAPPAYSNTIGNNNNMNTMRTPPVQITVQNVRATNLRPQYANLNVHYSGKNFFFFVNIKSFILHRFLSIPFLK